MANFDYAVLIGRFQPFHLGHEKLFRHAASIARHVIILIGSQNSPVSIRNPWDCTTREMFIRLSLSDVAPSKYSVRSIADSAYNFNDWLIRVQKQIASITAENASIAIVGHFKDDTSYYLSHFPRWNLEILPPQAQGISSTSIRNACFENNLSSIDGMINSGVFDELNRWINTSHFRQLQEEYRYIKDHRQKWQCAPSSPIFVTAEAVVTALGHVLLIKRKFNPGKGRYSLPGGLVKQDQTIEQACLRVLKSTTGIAQNDKELADSISMNRVFDHPTRDPMGRVITHAFMIELNVNALPEISSMDGAEETIWCPLYRLDELEQNFFNDHALIIKYFINRMR